MPRRGTLRPPDATARTRPSLTLPRGTNRLTRLVPARNFPTRVHPEQNALALAAPRLSPPRQKIRAGRRAPARPQPSRALRLTALPCNGGLGLRQKQACRVFADRAVLRDSRNVFLRRSGQLPHLVQRRSNRPTGKEKRRDSLSLTQRKAETGGQHAGPSLRTEAAQRRRFRRASGTSSIGSRPQNARRVRREFHKPFRRPFQRLAPERLGNTFTPRRHWGTTAHAPRIVKKYSCV